MIRGRAVSTALLLVMSAAGLGCSKEPRPGGGAATTQPATELTVLCGNSFVQPTEEMIEGFRKATGIAVAVTSAGSEDFLPLVKTGQRGDVLITHDPYLDYVREAKALADHCEVGFVAPVLAVQKGNPKGLTAVQDLAKPGLKVALSDPQYSTCGEMVQEYLKRKDIYDAVMKNVENRLTKGHGDLGTFLKTRTVDAVIMWNGVAHTFSQSVDVVPTPYDYDRTIRVHVIGLGYSKQPESVQHFIDFARANGPAIFVKYGYVK